MSQIQPQAATPTIMTGPQVRQQSTIEGIQTPSAEVTPAASIEEPLSPKFAEIAKREKRLVSRAQELKAREEALKVKEAEYSSSYVPKSNLADRFKNDPVGLMTEYGLSYEDLTQAILNQPSQDPALVKIQAELKDLKEAHSKTQLSIEDQSKKNYQQAIQQITAEVESMVDSNPDYEMIKETGSVLTVVKLIEETYKSDGVILSHEEAAKQIEDYLFEKSLKLAQMRKVKEKLNPSPAVEEKLSPTEKVPTPIKTLTNATTVSMSKPLGHKERRERAIMAFKGQLS